LTGHRTWTYDLYEMYEADNEHAFGRLSVSEAREAFADLVNRVAYRGDRVRVMRRGREVAAIVPIEDIELIERLEDRLDLEAARDALADPENAVPIPWEQVEAELGLDR
jgi:prevent-host-death family protein